MKLIKHISNMYDIFQGDGWETWTRIKVVKTTTGTYFFTRVSGSPLTKELILSLKKEFANV